jgi:hypothetical protein
MKTNTSLASTIGHFRTACTRLLPMLLVLTLPAAVQAQDYTYTASNGTITITRYTGPSGDVIIPSTIDGLPVIGIGNTAFRFRSVSSVTIPDSVTTIGNNAFDSCGGLAHVTIGNGVTNIGEYAFIWCGNLLSVTLGNSLTTIGNNAFRYCTRLPSVTIPASVTSIEEYAFTWCTDLRGVYFEGNAPQLASYVFYAADRATVYYLPGTTGWGPTFADRPTALWHLPYPVILDLPPSFGVKTNAFAFIISWATNADVAVEACTNLTNPVWRAVSTNTLTDGWCSFRDRGWTNYPARFYRLRSP